MIYEFTVENFRSFGTAQTLSLIKGKEQNKPENLITGAPGFPKSLRVAAIFGHNASGKSNLVQAAHVFWQTIVSSAVTLQPGHPIPGLISHKLDPAWEDKPTRFEAVFAMGGRVFRYGFSARPEAITAETLAEEFSSGKIRTLFERKERTRGDAANVGFSDAFDQVAKDNVPRLTRDNALVLSSGANLNVPLLRDLYTFILNGITFATFSPFSLTDPSLAKNVQEDDRFRGQLLEILRDADIGITGLRAEPPPEPSQDEVESFRRVLVPQHGDRAAEMARQHAQHTKFAAIFCAHVRNGGPPVEFGWGDESQGTRLVGQLFWLAIRAFESGTTVIIDKFGSNIHPLLAQRLVEMFQNPSNNRSGAQLIFTTHYSQLMTPALFRKDQIWMTEKTPAGQTELFSLTDFRGEKYTRSSEAFENNYLAGRYRGIGHFGPLLSGVPVRAPDATEGGAQA